MGRDGIPSLSNPEMVPAGTRGSLDYLAPDDRVIGLMVDGRAYAIPHNILWYHEIVNLDVGGEQVAVTLCPLTGTSLGFDRSSVGGSEFGVSGLLFKNNLIMFNREGEESLWPQMLAEARCGSSPGQSLSRWPVVEMTWRAWKLRHPRAMTVTDNTGFPHDYTASGYPYPENYDSPSNSTFLFPMPGLDPRRPPKERVLGVPPTATDSGIAFPFGVLEGTPEGFSLVEFTYDGEPAVVLWADEARGAMTFRPETTEGTPVSLRSTEDGIVDEATGSRWSVDGRAVSGDRSGERLVPVETAYTAFWGAWAAFFPDTRLWAEG